MVQEGWYILGAKSQCVDPFPKSSCICHTYQLCQNTVIWQLDAWLYLKLIRVWYSLFTDLLKDSLNEYAYDAEVAGLAYNIENLLEGMLVSEDDSVLWLATHLWK